MEILQVLGSQTQSSRVMTLRDNVIVNLAVLSILGPLHLLHLCILLGLVLAASLSDVLEADLRDDHKLSSILKDRRKYGKVIRNRGTFEEKTLAALG